MSYRIIRNSAKRLYRISFLRIILRDISVPTAHFIRSLEIRHLSNPTFAYKLDPFITDYTQVSRDALQNRKIAYNSIPFATEYTQIREKTQQNLDFAYKAEGRLRSCNVFYTQHEDSPPLKSCICVNIGSFYYLLYAGQQRGISESKNCE